MAHQTNIFALDTANSNSILDADLFLPNREQGYKTQFQENCNSTTLLRPFWLQLPALPVSRFLFFAALCPFARVTAVAAGVSFVCFNVDDLRSPFLTFVILATFFALGAGLVFFPGFLTKVRRSSSSGSDADLSGMISISPVAETRTFPPLIVLTSSGSLSNSFRFFGGDNTTSAPEPAQRTHVSKDWASGHTRAHTRAIT